MLIQSESKGNFLTFDDGEHTYTLNGRLVPGGSTIPKSMPTPIGLRKWEVGQGVYFAIEQLKYFPQPWDVLPEEIWAELFTKSKSAGKKKAKEAADIGSLVHEYAEHDKTPQLESVKQKIETFPDKEKVELCLREYLKWDELSGYKTIDSEQIIASVQYQWGGKYDRLVKSNNGKVILVDFKTSSGIFLEHKVQVGGCYNQALKEWRDIDLDGVDLVRFGKDGSFEHELITKKKELQVYIEQAIRCRATFEFMKEWEK